MNGITTEYTIWCSKCEEWYQTALVSTKAAAVKEFKAQGWKVGKTVLCPKCAEAALQREETE